MLPSMAASIDVPISAEVILIAGGFLLLLIGLIGGGVNIYVCKIPAVQGRARGCCAVLGVLLVVAGIGLLVFEHGKPITTADTENKANSVTLFKTVPIEIRDEFVEDKEHPDSEEEDTVTFGEKEVKFFLSKSHTADSKTIAIDNATECHYEFVTARRYKSKKKGKDRSVAASIRGVIDPTASQIFRASYVRESHQKSLIPFKSN